MPQRRGGVKSPAGSLEQPYPIMPLSSIIEGTPSELQAARALSCCKVAACAAKMALTMVRPLWMR
jgi:hypothetical protein